MASMVLRGWFARASGGGGQCGGCTSSPRNLSIISIRDPESTPEYSELLYLHGNRWFVLCNMPPACHPLGCGGLLLCRASQRVLTAKGQEELCSASVPFSARGIAAVHGHTVRFDPDNLERGGFSVMLRVVAGAGGRSVHAGRCICVQYVADQAEPERLQTA